MSRLLVMIASISLAVLAISLTCVASPTEWSGVTRSSSLIAATDGGYASPWPSSEAPSQIVAGGLLPL